MNPNSTTLRLVLLIAAIVCFLFGVVASGQEDGEVILNGLAWLGIGGAFFAGAHL